MGLSVETDLDLSRSMERTYITYITFFIEESGAWFRCVDASMSDVGELKRLIGIFLEVLIAHGVTVVGLTDRDKSLFEGIVKSMYGRRFSSLRVERAMPNVGGMDALMGASREMKRFGLDILSWQVRTDARRLMERDPKNPLYHSFCAGWKLRTEQLSYCALKAATALMIYEGNRCAGG